jgi:putative hydrolase of the HAD superfamily
MCSEWLETGSSKSRAFDKVFRKFGVKSEGLLSEYVADCLAIYRETVPVLTLAPRASFLISQLPREKIFLITDGQLTTQKNKFNALGLDAFFRPDHVFFTGAYGSDYYKPNTAILGKIQLPLHGAKVAYVGDREVDEDFSRAANWSFYRVSVMRG